ATYLAFARSPGTLRPWITLAVAASLCTFVSVERVRAGVHFPTDVIAGTIAGAGVGVLVPRLHQSGGIEERRVWVGFRREERGQGGELEVGGVF
ncbi:MAG TPA: phosphatase PAP2 family protein, partial [Polyangiaceae bacterium]|nr:phosphatase PAP2 family protein [Polyangiaceae bacterium]